MRNHNHNPDHVTLPQEVVDTGFFGGNVKARATNPSLESPHMSHGHNGTPESMKLSWRQKALLLGIGAVTMFTGFKYVNGQLDHEPAAPQEQIDGVNQINNNKTQNDIYANNPANTTIQVDPNNH